MEDVSANTPSSSTVIAVAEVKISHMVDTDEEDRLRRENEQLREMTHSNQSIKLFGSQ